MRIPFVNRKKELETLEQEYKKDFSFVILYGRRRVGKTRLIDEFTRDKRTLNFTVDEINDADNIESFQSQLAKFVGKPYLEQVSFSKWQDAFAQLREVKGKFTLVIDEFPYLIKANKSFPYIFQKIIDKQLRDQEVNVIVSGSSMSLMSDKVLAHKSPLYGRRTAQLRLDPLEFKHMKKFFPKYSCEDLVKVYTAVGGVPYYIEQFDKSKTPEENFQRLFLQKSGLLYEEVDILLESELRDVKNYKFILKKIAQGAQKMGEISEDTGFKSTSLTWYLDVLEKIGFVKKSKPLFSRPQDRSTLYIMNDQYMKFWFHFVHDRKMEVERGIPVRLLKTKLARYIESDFSKIAGELVSDKFQIYFDTQWGTCSSTVGHKIMLNTYSIDLIGVDNEKKILRIFDVEWKDLSVAQVHKLINELKQKSEFLPRKYASWEKVYGVVAKSVEAGDYDGDVFSLKDLM